METIKNKMGKKEKLDSLIIHYKSKSTAHVMDMQERGENVELTDSFLNGRKDAKFTKYVQNLRNIYKGRSSLNSDLGDCRNALNSNNIENVRDVFNKAFRKYKKLKEYYNIAENIIVKNMESLLRGNLEDEDILTFEEFDFREFD